VKNFFKKRLLPKLLTAQFNSRPKSLTAHLTTAYVTSAGITRHGNKYDRGIMKAAEVNCE